MAVGVPAGEGDTFDPAATVDAPIPGPFVGVAGEESDMSSASITPLQPPASVAATRQTQTTADERLIRELCPTAADATVSSNAQISSSRAIGAAEVTETFPVPRQARRR